MQALVINLPSSKDRLDFQVEQLNRLGINFEVIQAVSAGDLTEAEYKKLSGTWQRLMRRTEVACFLSHLKAWQRVIESNQACLILEDDAYLSNVTPELLQGIKPLKTYDLINLENRCRKKIVSKHSTKIVGDFNLIELFQDRNGAAGYILWPTGAKKLLAKYNKGKVELADAFISSNYKIKAFQVEPAAVIQLDQCENYHLKCHIKTQSIVAPDPNLYPRANSTLNKFLFRLQRLRGQIQMGVRQISVLHKSERRFIKLDKENFSSN